MVEWAVRLGVWLSGLGGWLAGGLRASVEAARRNLTVGSDVRLTCRVTDQRLDGDGVTIEWRKDGQLIARHNDEVY